MLLGAHLVARPKMWRGSSLSEQPASKLLQVQSNTTTLRKMALPLPSGLVPSEVAFLCEMELVTVMPRQRLDTIELLGVRWASQVARDDDDDNNKTLHSKLRAAFTD